MRKLAVLMACLALPLASCAGFTTASSPAPLTHTAIDDHAVRYAFLTLDTLATLADEAMDAKKITPGSPKAKTIAKGLTDAKHWVNAASAAQRAGSAATYNEAFQHASDAVALVKAALGKNTSLLIPNHFVPVDSVVVRLQA